jgi:FK506-binding nuclear protein
VQVRALLHQTDRSLSQIRITMAAIDPTEEIEDNEDGTTPQRPRSTLKLIKTRMGDGDIDGDDEEDDEELRRALGLDGEDEDEDEDDEDDEEVNGGPSDPAKSKKARRANGIEELLEATKDADSDDDMEDEDEDTKTNGLKNGKGKEKASDDDDDDDEDEEDNSDDDEDMDGLDLEQFVVCTLDPDSVSGSRFPRIGRI